MMILDMGLLFWATLYKLMLISLLERSLLSAVK